MIDRILKKRSPNRNDFCKVMEVLNDNLPKFNLGQMNEIYVSNQFKIFMARLGGNVEVNTLKPKITRVVKPAPKTVYQLFIETLSQPDIINGINTLKQLKLLFQNNSKNNDYKKFYKDEKLLKHNVLELADTLGFNREESNALTVWALMFKCFNQIKTNHADKN